MCVKETCPVEAYRKRDFDRHQFLDTIDELCRNCYRCVQGCPRELIFKASNPQYRQLGDDYWTPEIIALTWYQGTRKPEIWTRGGIPQWPSGVLFVGDRGMLLADYRKHMLLFDDKVKEFTRPPESIPKSVGHYQEWIDACKTGSPTTCHFGYSGWLTEANHLGNVAYRVGKKLEWDAEAMRATNAPEAEPFLTRAHRPGWTLA